MGNYKNFQYLQILKINYPRRTYKIYFSTSKFKEELMKPSIQTYLRLLCLVLGIIFLAEAQAADPVKRYTLLEDKFRTIEMLRAPGHDFLFDVSAWLNADVQEVIDEAEGLSKTPGDTAAKIAAATAFLNKYDKTEQTLRVNVDFGIPIFSFTIGGIKFIPDFRFGFNLGFHLGIESRPLTAADIASLVPAEFAEIASCGLNPAAGEDIVALYIAAACSDASEEAAATPYLNKYFWPSNAATPSLFPYIKGEAHAGFLVNWIKGENWFGHVNLYALGRSDVALRVTADTLARNADTVDLPEEDNTTINAATDIQLGYTHNKMTAYASINEIKIATVSDNIAKGGETNYGFDPLFRLHGEYEMELAFLDFKPFAGLHKRKAYDFTDGLYVGAEVGAFVWGDRLGLMFRGMLDTEHITFTPRAKLWFAQLEYSLKVPVKGEIDGVKPSSLHSLDFRLFF